MITFVHHWLTAARDRVPRGVHLLFRLFSDTLREGGKRAFPSFPLSFIMKGATKSYGVDEYMWTSHVIGMWEGV